MSWLAEVDAAASGAGETFGILSRLWRRCAEFTASAHLFSDLAFQARLWLVQAAQLARALSVEIAHGTTRTSTPGMGTYPRRERTRAGVNPAAPYDYVVFTISREAD
jgi:hypothetical protein